jgi:hypothetical protein
MVIGTDCIGSCKSNYNAITTKGFVLLIFLIFSIVYHVPNVVYVSALSIICCPFDFL